MACRDFSASDLLSLPDFGPGAGHLDGPLKQGGCAGRAQDGHGAQSCLLRPAARIAHPLGAFVMAPLLVMTPLPLSPLCTASPADATLDDLHNNLVAAGPFGDPAVQALGAAESPAAPTPAPVSPAQMQVQESCDIELLDVEDLPHNPPSPRHAAARGVEPPGLLQQLGAVLRQQQQQAGQPAAPAPAPLGAPTGTERLARLNSQDIAGFLYAEPTYLQAMSAASRAQQRPLPVLTTAGSGSLSTGAALQVGGAAPG